MASSMVLTQVYLDKAQKKALVKRAGETGRSVSDLMRDGAAAVVAGITMDDLNILDEGTKRAKQDIDAMVAVMDKNAKEHRAFLRAMAALEKDDA